MAAAPEPANLADYRLVPQSKARHYGWACSVGLRSTRKVAPHLRDRDHRRPVAALLQSPLHFRARIGVVVRVGLAAGRAGFALILRAHHRDIDTLDARRVNLPLSYTPRPL